MRNPTCAPWLYALVATADEKAELRLLRATPIGSNAARAAEGLFVLAWHVQPPRRHQVHDCAIRRVGNLLPSRAAGLCVGPAPTLVIYESGTGMILFHKHSKMRQPLPKVPTVFAVGGARADDELHGHYARTAGRVGFAVWPNFCQLGGAFRMAASPEVSERVLGGVFGAPFLSREEASVFAKIASPLGRLCGPTWCWKIQRLLPRAHLCSNHRGTMRQLEAQLSQGWGGAPRLSFLEQVACSGAAAGTACWAQGFVLVDSAFAGCTQATNTAHDN